jgi:hypothetical protein
MDDREWKRERERERERERARERERERERERQRAPAGAPIWRKRQPKDTIAKAASVLTFPVREGGKGERKEGRAARARKGAYLQKKTAQKHDRQSGERLNLSKIE